MRPIVLKRPATIHRPYPETSSLPMRTWVDITAVSSSPAEDRLAGGAIEQPVPGSVSDRFASWVSGFVVGVHGPAARIDVLNDGVVIQSFAVELDRSEEFSGCPWASTAGFGGWLGTLAFDRRFALSLRAVFPDGSGAALGMIDGRTEPVRTDYRSTFRPLLVTTMGRSGSTILMHYLDQACDITCGAEYPYELQIGRYWVHVLDVVTSPADERLSDGRWRFASDPFHVGRNPFYDNQAHALRDWLQTDCVIDAVVSTQRQIDHAYTAMATIQPSAEGPRYFAEKSSPGRVAALTRRIYPEYREIILVRDLRDIYCSVVAFNAKRGYDGFGRDTIPDDSEYIRSLASGAHVLLARMHQSQGACLLIRYEDLVTDPGATVQLICSYLGLSRLEPANHPDEMVRRAHASEHVFGGHRTTASSSDSIGRWRRDMPRELLHACVEHLDEVLVTFGYEPTIAPE